MLSIVIRRQATKGRLKSHASISQEYKEFLSFWTKTLEGLASKAWAWGDELCRLDDRILTWLDDLDDSSAEDTD